MPGPFDWLFYVFFRFLPSFLPFLSVWCKAGEDDASWWFECHVHGGETSTAATHCEVPTLFNVFHTQVLHSLLSLSSSLLLEWFFFFFIHLLEDLLAVSLASLLPRRLH